MRVIKIVTYLLVFLFSIQAIANKCRKGDVPDSLLENYLSSSILETDRREWSPISGSIAVTEPNKILVTFKFDPPAIDILQSRNDMALEIDIVDKDGILSKKWSFEQSDNFESDIIFKKDNAFMDKDQLSVIAIGTNHLTSGKEYKVTFSLDEEISEVGRLKLNLDLAVYFDKDLSIVPPCINPFEGGKEKPGSYFTLEIEQYSAFWYYPYTSAGVCWVDQYASTQELCFLNNDNDNDNIPDHEDNCKYIQNENQIDTDNNGAGDDCDGDPNDATNNGDGSPSDPDYGYIEEQERKHKHRVSLQHVYGSIAGQDDWEGELRFVKGTVDKIDLEAKVRNKEKGSVKDVYIDYYASENRWFSRSHDTLLDTDHISKLKGRKRTRKHSRDIDISNLDVGNYYYFVDVRYKSGHNISSRSDDSEYVKLVIVNPPPLGDFEWSYKGAIDGYYCTQIYESADPDGWHDNYFCTKDYYDIRWSSDGAIAGMRCTQILEGSDPHSWDDNYLCVQEDSPLAFSWSYNGAIDGEDCVQWLEPSDPGTWDDNFLCHRAVGSPPPIVNGVVETMRFYNTDTKSHLFSVRPDDLYSLHEKWPEWEYHGTSFKAFVEQQVDTVPIYTCWTDYQAHIYSQSQSYAQSQCSNNEPFIAFYAYSSDGADRKPIRQLWHPQNTVYIYSNGEADADHLVSTFGFQKQDIAWYAPL